MELQADMIKINQNFVNEDDAIKLAGQILVDAGCVTPEYVDAMIDRNNDVSTYMGNFIAIPHGTDAGKQYQQCCKVGRCPIIPRNYHIIERG